MLSELEYTSINASYLVHVRLAATVARLAEGVPAAAGVPNPQPLHTAAWHRKPFQHFSYLEIFV